MNNTNVFRASVLSFLTVLSLCLSFPPVDWGILAWIACVPWLVLVATGEKYVYPGSLAVGVAFFFIQLSWLRHVTVIAWVLLSLYCAAYFPAFAWCVRYAVLTRRWPLVLVVPCVWTALEFIRSFFLSGFPWFFLGHTQYRYLPVIQAADVVGVHGISFAVIMVNAGIADLITNVVSDVRGTVLPASSPIRTDSILKKIFPGTFCAERRIRPKFPRSKPVFYGLVCLLPLAVAVVFLLYGLSWLQRYKPQEGPTLCMVQGNIPQEVKFESTEEDELQIMKKYADLSLNTKGRQVDLLVWPETMMPGLLNIDPELTGRKIDLMSQITAVQLAQELNANAIFGGIALTLVGDEQIYFNSAYYYNRRGKLLDRYDKIHLVPFGEFTPLKKYFPFLAGLVPYEIGLTHGARRTLFHLDDFTFGASICYEDTVPSLMRRFRKDGADFMLNVTNDGWFRDSAELDQHLAIMVFRAVENRICFARAANTGISAFVSPDGFIYDRLSDRNGRHREIAGTLINRVRYVKCPITVYTMYGDWFSVLCVVASCAMLFAATFTRYFGAGKTVKE